MENCVFCKIIKKESPAKIVFENDDFLAFLPLAQTSKGHTLVIPKKHFENIFDIQTEYLEKLMDVAQQLANQLAKENNATGVNLLHASGVDAGQSVFHFHLHIVPRYKNDGLNLWLEGQNN